MKQIDDGCLWYGTPRIRLESAEPYHAATYVRHVPVDWITSGTQAAVTKRPDADRQVELFRPVVICRLPGQVRRFHLVHGLRQLEAARAENESEIPARILLSVPQTPGRTEAELRRVLLAGTRCGLEEMEALEGLLNITGLPKQSLAYQLGISAQVFSNIIKNARILPAVRTIIRDSQRDFSRRRLWLVADERGEEQQMAKVHGLLTGKQRDYAVERVKAIARRDQGRRPRQLGGSA